MDKKSDRAVVHFETQRKSKTRWVKQAQLQGMGLREWIEETLNRSSEPLRDDRSDS